MTNRPGYKHTPLGWIPEEWVISELGKVCEVKGRIGYRGYTTNDIVPKGHGAITVSPSNIYANEVRFESNTYISWYKYEESPEIQLEQNDILFVKTGSTFGKSAIIKSLPEKATINPQLVVIKRVTCDVYYLSYVISSDIIQKQVNATVVGGAIPTLSQENILSFIFPFAPLCQQRKIATILSTWDEAIIITQKLLAQLYLRNNSLMQQLLTGKKRLKGFSKQWKEIHLADAFNERSETGFVNLDLLSVGSLGVYPQSQSEKRDTSNSDKAKYKRICPRDIGYNTMRMWQGRSALSSLEGIVSPAYTIVTPKDGHHSQFYAYLFKLPSVVNKFFRNSQGLVEDTLNCKFKDFSIVKVEVPEYQEQVAIANVLKTAQAEIKSYEQKLNALQQQKKGLMQKLLTGEVRVKI